MLMVYTDRSYFDWDNGNKRAYLSSKKKFENACSQCDVVIDLFLSNHHHHDSKQSKSQKRKEK